jgi:DNA processing protein
VAPTACDDCLRRAWLVASLSPEIEAAVADQPGHRARELLALGDADLAAALARRRAKRILLRSIDRNAPRLRAAVRGAHAWACCRHDEAYPAALEELTDPPAVIFGRGDPELLAPLAAEGAVTIVGARRPSAYGRELATLLGREVASGGIAVVSGMALGIDSCAHRGALEAGGMTAAVLGSGPDVPNPARMQSLYDEIVDQGLVLAELPPGASARRWTFPARNRIMAALGAMTVVVEARQRSGSLITSEMAQDLGREVGAVPGRVGHSPAAGTNNLLRDGAQVIRSGQDVLDSLLGIGVIERRRSLASRNGPRLDPELASVLELIEGGASSSDAVARGTELEAGEAAAALARLELLGYVRCDSAGRYQRSTLERDSQPH